jgi:hypothetical protein
LGPGSGPCWGLSRVCHTLQGCGYRVWLWVWLWVCVGLGGGGGVGDGCRTLLGFALSAQLAPNQMGWWWLRWLGGAYDHAGNMLAQQAAVHSISTLLGKGLLGRGLLNLVPSDSGDTWTGQSPTRDLGTHTRECGWGMWLLAAKPGEQCTTCVLVVVQCVCRPLSLQQLPPQQAMLCACLCGKVIRPSRYLLRGGPLAVLWIDASSCSSISVCQPAEVALSKQGHSCCWVAVAAAVVAAGAAMHVRIPGVLPVCCTVCAYTCAAMQQAASSSVATG